MREKRITAVIMSLFMVFSLLPATVFAAAVSTLDGKLKVKGDATVGTALSADFTDVKPEEIPEDGVSYVWSRKALADTENKNLKELSKEKTYSVTQEDLGSVIVLTITGLEDKGFSGTLKAETEEIKEAAPAETDAENTSGTEGAEELPSDEYLEQVPDTEGQTGEYTEETTDTEIPTEEYVEETTDTEPSTGEYVEEAPEAGSEALEGIPEAQEDGDASESSVPETEDYALAENEVLTPVNELLETEGEDAGSESVDGIPPAQEDGTVYGGNTAEEPVYAAEAVTPDGSGVLDFGTFSVNEITEDKVLTVTIRNIGTGTLNFLEIAPENFMVQDITESLDPGEEAVVAVAPRENTAAGAYEDTITYITEEGLEVSFGAKMVLTEAEEPEEPETSALTADQDALDFTVTDAQVVCITNTSDAEISVQASSQNGNVIADSTTDIISPGGFVEFSIKPSETLVGGQTYEDVLTFTDTANPVNTVSVSVTVTLPGEEPEKTSEVTAEKNQVDFGTVLEGYQETPADQSVELVNNGAGAASLSDPVSVSGANDFEVLLADTELPAGATTHLLIRPKLGLAVGTHSEKFVITDTTANNEIVITVSLTVEAVKHSLSVSPQTLDFASAKKGYGQIEAQQITVTNNGNVAETLTQPVGSSFEVGTVDASALTVQPGASVSFTIRPKTGLDTGTYEEAVKVASQDAEASVTLSFQVIKGTATINKIETPNDIKGLANGTKKDAKSLGLPSTVVIGTTAGNMKAAVSWDVENCSYDPSALQEQNFSIKGTVTLPDGVDNDNNLTLATSIRVQVKAYTPATVSADNNKITGIEYNGVYTTQSRISFTAVGAGMDNTAPRKGDTRYLPLNWKVINTNNWSGSPYTATFGMAKSGDYTLKVTFRLQTYDGSTWRSSETYDTKEVPFSISKASVTGPGQNLTPAANRRNAVRTGDNTPVLPFVIILVVAVAAISGVVVYRKRK